MAPLAFVVSLSLNVPTTGHSRDAPLSSPFALTMTSQVYPASPHRLQARLPSFTGPPASPSARYTSLMPTAVPSSPTRTSVQRLPSLTAEMLPEGASWDVTAPSSPMLGSPFPRSRRSSVALAMSVSLASESRSRSRTPRGMNAQLPDPEELGDLEWHTGLMEDSDEEPEPESDDIFVPGQIFGEGLAFQGEVVEAVVQITGLDETALRRAGSEYGYKRATVRDTVDRRQYKVVRTLGTGSYATVYLVKEVGGKGKEFALKCLSKQDLEEDSLQVQLFEATIHLSLPIHQNIVTLHQTLQTHKWLFLMLELCPGEDLFYWLEKSRDASPPPANAQLEPFSSSKMSSSSIPFSSSQLMSGMNSYNFSNSLNHSGSYNHSFSYSPTSSTHPPFQTPPTPSLLSAFSANTLLTPRRLRLIASMFAQMCEAVAVCHDAGVSHRDIKPENFICCDSTELEAGGKRKVIVKLTDFGLATTEAESGDVECGSKPYMAYECRNNLAPVYSPAPADVWSLGIVLINMVFHRNPWKDPTPGDLNFDSFLEDPVQFLLGKFTGIGRDVASYLARHVLCIDVEDRVSARDLGHWVKTLPEMIGGRKAVGALRATRLDMSKPMFAKTSVERPLPGKSGLASALSFASPVSPPTASPVSIEEPPSAVPELEPSAGPPTASTEPEGQLTPVDLPEPPEADDDETRSVSAAKRRKRGVRKGKAAQAAAAAAAAGDNGTSQAERDALLAELAAASQSLAREISKKHKPDLDVDKLDQFPPLGAPEPEAKKSKWKGMIKLSNGNPELAALAQRVADRNASTGGNWSAPAKMQHGHGPVPSRSRQTATASSGFSSAISSFGQDSSTSATSSSNGPDDDWRKPKTPTSPLGAKKLDHTREKRRDDFKRYPSGTSSATSSLYSRTNTSQLSTVSSTPSRTYKPPGNRTSNPNVRYLPGIPDDIDELPRIDADLAKLPPRPSVSSIGSDATLPSLSASPNRPKIKGQIQSLAKMLSGLKTKSKD